MSPAGRANTSVRFTEEMKGHVAVGESDPGRGERLGRERGTRLMFHLTIEVDDIDSFRHDPRRPGPSSGWVACDVFGGRREVERGDFNLFVDDDVEPGRKWMLYRLWFRDGTGRALTLVGVKDVFDDARFDAWADTTTLYTRILDGHVEAAEDGAAPVVASGIIYIRALDFARQLTTFRSSGPSLRSRVGALVTFGACFVSQLADVYLRRRPTSPPAPWRDGGGSATSG